MAASSPAHLAAALFRFRKGALECGGLPGEGGGKGRELGSECMGILRGVWRGRGAILKVERPSLFSLQSY